MSSAVYETRRQRRGIQALRTSLSSIMDIAAGWVFYHFDARGFNETLGRALPRSFKGVALTVCILSTIVGVFHIVQQCCMRTRTSIGGRSCFGRTCRNHWSRILEIFVMDIPQIILSAFVALKFNGRGWMSPASLFNMLTSVYNMGLNMLDMGEETAVVEKQVAPEDRGCFDF